MLKDKFTASINVDRMLLFVFELSDDMTFISAELNKDEVPLEFVNDEFDNQ